MGAAADRSGIVIKRGVCSALFAYDIGLSVDLDAAERVIREATQRESIRHRRRAPKYFEYRPAPLRVSRPAEPVAVGPRSTAPVVECVFFDFGAVSVAFSIPLAGTDGAACTLAELLAISDALYENEALLAASRRHVEELLAAVAPAVKRARVSTFVEDYAIYQLEELDAPPPVDPNRIIGEYAPELARVLRAEPGSLSSQEIEDALASRLSYTAQDATIVDWNASIVIDRDAEDVRTVLEYANVELLEMRLLDEQLDAALDEAHRALPRRGVRRLPFGPADAQLRRIAELQMDAALLFEGVNNALKLLGDQYLARLYRLAANRLHLPEWDASILRKLQTADSIYEKLSDRRTNLRMEILEWIIILLIAFEIITALVRG